ncbi:galactitol-1-phosphate 5-dehydrogenase [Chelonobacter oris]|uniref:galactitol-1-phosphate 5-dehydrogenase n=1 Tax=Chelonobacter oris TaxID=505317 RepID=UPI00244B3897|nr:galactitol-1-phosphate 5-dehydrogenase [Chelonobacter oris]MDH3000363.1 galactitol-1-phosphate 5-dehydrogenase [Chelonobacter oris]
MKAIIVESNRNLVLADIPKPQLSQNDDVLVKVRYSGVCGSDLPRIFHNGAHNYPIILGHEFCGIIEKTGSHVHGLAPGDMVVCAPLLPCFDCEECRQGFYSLCKNYTFVGSRRQGANAEYIVVNEKNLVKIPKDSDPLFSSFIEPVTVGLHAIYLADGCHNKNVIILGAGTIGLLALQCAKALGAKSTTVIDINNDKLLLAKKLGANHTFNPQETDSAAIQNALNESRFNQLILETAGVPQTVTLALNIAGPRAQVLLVGTLHHDLHLNQKDFGLILRKELTITGSWMNYSKPWPGEEWLQASKLINEGNITLEPLIASINLPEQYLKEVYSLAGKPMNGKIILKFQA